MNNKFRQILSGSFIRFIICALMICVGLFLIIPEHEGIGNLWVMLFSIAAGINFTRLMRDKKKK